MAPTIFFRIGRLKFGHPGARGVRVIDEPGGHFFILIHIPGRLLKAGGVQDGVLRALGAGLHLLLLPLRCGRELKELEYYAHLIGRGAWCSSRPLPAHASGRSRTGEELHEMFEVGQIANHFGQVGAGNWQVMSCVALGQG